MNIGIVARLDTGDAIKLANEIVEFLLEKRIKITIDSSLSLKLGKYKELSCDLENMDVDMILAIGGDGTILRTQNFINGKQIPLFGINMGTVGFLTEIEPEDVFRALDEVLAGNYFIEKKDAAKGMPLP